jgi:hypothetical protein
MVTIIKKGTSKARIKSLLEQRKKKQNLIKK